MTYRTVQEGYDHPATRTRKDPWVCATCGDPVTVDPADEFREIIHETKGAT